MKIIEGFRSLGAVLGLASFALCPASLFAQGARLQLDNLNKLAEKAYEVNDVTLDGSMLQLAQAFVPKSEANADNSGPQVQNILKNLKGIYIKNFKFHQANAYSQADVDNIIAQLAAPGWVKIVENHEKDSGATNEVCLMKDGDKVAGLAVFSAEAKELSVVNIVGQIDMASLGALAGSFGVPKNVADAKDPALKARKAEDAREAALKARIAEQVKARLAGAEQDAATPPSTSPNASKVPPPVAAGAVR